MARARNIKPGFYKNEDLAECSIWARYIYPGLWMLADREGRLEDRQKRIKAELLPMDSQEVEPLLVELAERGFIVRYQVDGRAVIWIPAFLKHQNPHHRERPSELPPHPSLGLEPDGKDTKPEASPSMGSKPGASTPLQGGQAVLNPSSLNPSSLNPESMPTGACAPAAGLTEAQVWQAGIELLSKAGMAEAQARTFLGKLARDHGKQSLHEAVGAAVAEQPVDPRAYLRAASAKTRGGGHSLSAGFKNVDYTQGVNEHGALI